MVDQDHGLSCPCTQMHQGGDAPRRRCTREEMHQRGQLGGVCWTQWTCQIGAGRHVQKDQGQAKLLLLRITIAIVIVVVGGAGAGAATHKVQSCVQVDLTSPTKSNPCKALERRLLFSRRRPTSEVCSATLADRHRPDSEEEEGFRPQIRPSACRDLSR